MRPRILIITRNYPPLVGGMERLLHHTAVELVPQFDVGLCGPWGCSAFAPASGPVVEIPPKPLSKFLLESLSKSLRLAFRWRPDIVFAGSGLTAPAALMVGKLLGKKTITYVHGLDLTAGHPIYRAIFLPAIRRSHLVLVNSESTRELALRIGVAANRISILHPGVDLPMPPTTGAIAQFRERIGAAERPILLSVGRLTRRKGLAEFIEYGLGAIVDAIPDVLLVVVGNPALDAVAEQGSDVTERIRQAIDSHHLENNVIMVGQLDEESLSLAYSAASALVFPIREVPGDIEGFGMVALEAAAHGVPTIAFRVGGVPDAVADHVSGYLIPPERYDHFAVRTIALLKGKARPADCIGFASRFAWPLFGRHLRATVHAALKAPGGGETT